MEDAPGYVSNESEEDGTIISSKAKAAIGRSRRRANLSIADHGDSAGDDDQREATPTDNSVARNTFQATQATEEQNVPRRAAFELEHTIIISEKPRRRTAIWPDGLLHQVHNQTVESCFEQISKRISRPDIQEIHCQLVSSLEGRFVTEHSDTVHRDQQARFDGMRKIFKKRIAVARNQGDSSFKIMVTPDGVDQEVIDVDETEVETDDEEDDG